MDGNLLDPETADETLAKDWNLPELPEGNSSLPSTSQELAEIFGTSDDEEDVDFPFSLSAGLPGELSLPNANTKKFGSSLLGNPEPELFLSTFHDALNSIPPVPVSINQPLAGEVAQGNEVRDGSDKKDGNKIKEDVPNEKGVELMDEGVKEQKKSTEVKPQDAEDETKPSSQDVKSEGHQTTPVLRKSARLRQRKSSDEEKSDPTAEKAVVKSATSVKEEPGGGDEKTVKEEPGVKSGEEEQSTAVKEEPGVVTEEDKRYIKSEERETADDSSDESEEESDEDPDRLWCICQQPHDDRFMICCDQCEEWYHGDCVGISVGQGKRMEREGKEYVCPVCVARLEDAKAEREINRTERQVRRELAKDKDTKQETDVKEKDSKEKDAKKKTGHTHHRRISSGASHAPKVEEDQYGAAQLFLPDNAPKEKKGGVSSPLKTKKVEAVSSSMCVGPGCEKPTTPPSVYCSKECIEKHASISLKKLSDRGVLHSSNPSEFVRGAGGVSVVERGTGKLLVGIAAPSEKNLIPWLKEHPSYQVYLHAKAGKKRKKPKAEKKEPESPSSTIPKIPLMDPKSVRANAKKALFQTLWKRCEDMSDLTDLDQEAVEKVANDIEEKLHNLYQDINPKYKNKYRSLLFNLKDTKNPGLFRKVLRGDIETRQLVRMSSEKLASEELAQWRQQTIKKDLEKIKEREEDALAHGSTIRKKTYKGDVEIESSEKIEVIEMIDITKEQGTNNSSKKSHSQNSKSQSDAIKSHSQSKSKADASSKPSKPAGSILDLLTDTTSQHGSHVYDQHCAICSGKMKKPSSPPQSAQAADDSSHPSPDSRTADSELMETTSPDTVSDAETHDVESQFVWRGEFSMHGMAKFAACAYTVSGPVEYLDEILPPVLEVMGRIAHVQVWDYVDKLRSSTSRDIVVLRFDRVEEDSIAYMAMLNYLVGKHRCGVIKSGYHGIKDMYLLPLLRNAPVAPQLLPFDGPGLPYDHPDTLLGVIVRSKNRKRPSISRRLSSSQSTFLPMAAAPPPPILPSSSGTGIKRHNSASIDMGGGGRKVKKARFRMEVGIGGQTPPILDETPPSSDNGGAEKGKSDDDSPYEPGSLDPLSDDVQEGEARIMRKIQMSFYGEHRPMEATAAENGREKEPPKAGGGEAVEGSVNLPTSSSFQSFLSQLSKEKLDELASVVSSISGQPGSASTAATGGAAATQSPIKTATPPTGGESRGNFEMVNTATAIPSTTEAGGGGGGQLNVGHYDAAAGQDMASHQVPLQQLSNNVGSFNTERQWHQEQPHPQQLPQQAQAQLLYQGAQQYSAEQRHPTATGVGIGNGAAEHPQAYPVQGGHPYANYPPPGQNQAAVTELHQNQEGRASGIAAVTNYAASQSHQPYGGDRQVHAHHAHQPHPHHWENREDYRQRQDYGHAGSHYYNEHVGRGGPYTRAPLHRGHLEGKPRGGWERGGHRGHHYRGRGGHNRYHDNWHRGEHDRDHHWR